MATSPATSGSAVATAAAPLTTLVLLTYRRNYLLERQLTAIAPWHERLAEVIVIDNANEDSTAALCARYPWVKLIRSKENLGAAGRNLGFKAARSAYIVTLDDDVVDFKPEQLPVLEQLFRSSSIACINFKVLEEGTGRLVNWVHHRAPERFANTSFDTYEITEGAVAFRRECLEQVGGYPESFFLSHEGPDLAYRLMNQGWRVIYSPQITVTHLFAPEGRANWRNYYFDTRNTLWLVIRNLPFLYGAKLLLRQNCAMGFYSLRDRFLGTWLKAWWHALRGAPREWRARQCVSASTLARLKVIDSFRPSFLRLVLSKLRSPVHRL